MCSANLLFFHAHEELLEMPEEVEVKDAAPSVEHHNEFDWIPYCNLTSIFLFIFWLRRQHRDSKSDYSIFALCLYVLPLVAFKVQTYG